MRQESNFNSIVWSILAVSICFTTFVFSSLLISADAAAQMTNEEVAASRHIEENGREIHLASVRASEHYQQSLALCQASGVVDVIKKYGPISIDAAKDVGAIVMNIPENGARAYRNGFIPPEVAALMDSEGFQLALRDCGDVEGTIGNMKVADYVGKAAGMAGIYVTYRFLKAKYKGFAATHAWAPYGLFTLAISYSFYEMSKVVNLLKNKNPIEAQLNKATDEQNRATVVTSSKRQNLYTKSVQHQLEEVEARIKSNHLPPDRLESDVALAYRLRMVLKAFEVGS